MQVEFATSFQLNDFGCWEEVAPLVPFQSLDEVPIRERLMRLEAAMLEHPQIPIETRHVFADGLYAREIFIPKGTLLTGKIHRTEHINIVSKGDISVLTEEGVKRIKAPFTMVSSPGIKRAGYAHEDTVWTTIHATNERDLEKLEAELIAPNYEQLETSIVTLLTGDSR